MGGLPGWSSNRVPMPIIRVSALPQPPCVDTAQVLRMLCARVAETLDAPADTVLGNLGDDRPRSVCRR